jgi:peptidoglycan LD-endopeptidase LytH
VIGDGLKRYPLGLLCAAVIIGCAPEDPDADLAASLDTVTASDALPDSTPALPSPLVVPQTKTDTLATELELALLSSALDVPVQGVARTELRDTYIEPRTGHVHNAIDILAPRGTPVLSAADGRLLKLFTSKAGGLMVYATDRTERFILLYAHMDRYAAGMQNGMPLARGQVIGYVGTTGNAPPGTPHLHFGILRGNVSWSKGAAVNPYPLLVAKASATAGE